MDPIESNPEIANAILAYVGEHPGIAGRLRVARIIGGYTVPHREDDPDWSTYACEAASELPLRAITRHIDELVRQDRLRQTPGPRPVLVLTLTGYDALRDKQAQVGAA